MFYLTSKGTLYHYGPKLASTACMGEKSTLEYGCVRKAVKINQQTENRQVDRGCKSYSSFNIGRQNNPVKNKFPIFMKS